MPQLRSKFLVSTFSCFKVIACFIFVYEFVKYAGKNIRTSDAKRRGSPNKLRAIILATYQRWTQGHKARGQDQGHKKFRGQAQGQTLEISRPRPRTKDTGASVFQKEKNGHQENFSGDLKKI